MPDAQYSADARCAHLKVTYVTQQTTGSTAITGWWQCCQCAMRFVPEGRAPALAGTPTDTTTAEHFARAIVSEYLGEPTILTDKGFARAVRAAEKLLRALAGTAPADEKRIAALIAAETESWSWEVLGDERKEACLRAARSVRAALAVAAPAAQPVVNITPGIVVTGGHFVPEAKTKLGAEAMRAWHAEYGAAPAAPAPDEHPEDFCQRCGQHNVVWFVDSALWNRAIRDKAFPEILCPVCFIQLAEAAGIQPSAWRLSPENDFELREHVGAAPDQAPTPEPYSEEVGELVQFFQDEEITWGYKGDDEGWSTERAAIELIRELRRQIATLNALAVVAPPATPESDLTTDERLWIEAVLTDAEFKGVEIISIPAGFLRRLAAPWFGPAARPAEPPPDEAELRRRFIASHPAYQTGHTRESWDRIERDADAYIQRLRSAPPPTEAPRGPTEEINHEG